MALENIVEAAAEPVDNANPAGVQDEGNAASDADVASDDDDTGDEGEDDGNEDDEGAGEDTGDEASEKDNPSADRSAKIDKRIAKLVASRKDAEARAREAEQELARLKGTAASDAAAARQAEKAGVLPELVGKDEAKAIAEWQNAKANEKFLSDWLEDHDGDEELEVGGKSYSRAEVRRIRRDWREKLEALGDGPEKALKRAGAELAELLKLGREAKKAGWKPGATTPKAPVKPSKPKGATAPGEGHPVRKSPSSKATVDFSKMGSEDGLAAAIAAGAF